MITISCIIPTFNRIHSLMQALHSLQKQALPEFEILVIDNAADSEVERLIKEFNQTARIKIVYIPEPDIGLHYARHTGACKATGDVLVFTDDDASFDVNWLQEYARHFERHTEMAAAGGPVQPIWVAPPPEWLSRYLKETNKIGLFSLMEPYTEFRLKQDGFFFGVNMAIRRDVLFEVRGFNPDSFGKIWLGDGECGLNRKLWEGGMLIGYIPNALVYHHIPPERMTMDYLYNRMANQAACDMYALYHQRIPKNYVLLGQAIAIMLKKKFWIRPFFYRGRRDPLSLDIQMYAVLTKSQVKYILRLLFDKNFRAFVVKNDWLNGTENKINNPTTS